MHFKGNRNLKIYIQEQKTEIKHKQGGGKEEHKKY